jgi:hypothetical protein
MTPEQKRVYEEMEANDRNRYALEVGFFYEPTSRLGLSSSLSWIFPCTGRRRCEDSQWCMDRMNQLIDDSPEEEEIVATIGLLEVALTSGKWYYEIEILEAFYDLQPGWARRGWEQLQPGQPGQYGCGEDRFSYAACSGFYLHDSEECSEESKALCWSFGDTVGLMLDLECREIRFSVNGECDEFVFRSISVDSAYYPAISMRAGVVDINFGGSRALKFLPEGYTPIAEEQTLNQLRAEVEALDTQIHRSTERHEANLRHEATLLEIKAKYDAATAFSEASMKIIEGRIDDLGTILRNPDPSGALYVLGLLDKLDEAARGAGEAAAPSQQGASGSTGWRHASVEDYGRAMRIALEELAESDRDERRRGREEHEKLLKGLARLRQEHDKRTADFHLESELAAERFKPRR